MRKALQRLLDRGNSKLKGTEFEKFKNTREKNNILQGLQRKMVLYKVAAIFSKDHVF